jgi:hypothetical protein
MAHAESGILMPLRLVGYSVAAAIAFVAQSGARGEPLGRLFFSPEERAQLDAHRNTAKPIPAPGPVVSTLPPAKREPQSVLVPAPQAKRGDETPPRRQVMTGFVERSSGSNTVWMNNQAQHVEGGYGELDPLDVGKARHK